MHAIHTRVRFKQNTFTTINTNRRGKHKYPPAKYKQHQARQLDTSAGNKTSTNLALNLYEAVSLMKGCLSASLGAMRLSGSRAIMRSKRSASCITFLRGPSDPASKPAKSFLMCGAAIVRRICIKNPLQSKTLGLVPVRSCCFQGR